VRWLVIRADVPHMAAAPDKTSSPDSGQPGLVSIALCTYNGTRFLAQQLDSLVAQTYPNLEIVISDDRSTDDTLTILNDYARRDPRIKVIAHADNVGLTRNFQRALRLCSGSYIAPCDQDDIWLPEKISTLVQTLGHRCLAYCDSSFVDEQGKPLGSRMSDVVCMITTDDPLPFAFANCISGHAMLFKREVLQLGIPVPPHFFYDWWLATVAAALGGVVYCDKPLVHYRQHGSNITDTLGRRMTDERPRGHMLRFLSETLVRLESIGRLPGPHREFAAEMCKLWRAREDQWFSPRLGWLLVRNRDRLFRISRTRKRTLRRQLKQYFYGLRLQRFRKPYQYSLNDWPE
jgi:glycosyltransferase involved in cell wall biosynthesis